MKKVFLFFLLWCGIHSFAHPYSNLSDVNRSVDRLEHFNDELPRETVYVHLDRFYFSPGDTIWLKAYVVSGVRNLLSNLSRIVYVDLIDPDDNLIQSVRLPLSSGIGIGDFSLPLTLSDGEYRIRAYTNWMRNFDEAYFFETTLNIFDPISPNDPIGMEKKSDSGIESSDSSTDDPIKIDLFPEGGSLSAGQLNRVAVKITHRENHSSAARGWVETSRGGRIMEIQTDIYGLGSFMFIPEQGEDYFAGFEDENERINLRKLPWNDKSGYGLAVNNLFDDNLIVEVRANPQEDKRKKLSLMIHHRGELLLGLSLDAEKEKQTFNIPKKKLGDGVNEIVLLSERMTPLAYRKVFNLQQSRSLPIQVETDRTAYATRERVKVSLDVGDGQDPSRVGSFSVSVTHQEKTSYISGNADNIFTSLLLKPSIKGNTPLIELMNLRKDIESNTRLDNFLLTMPIEFHTEKQGDEILFPIERDMRISGLVTKANGRAEVKSRVTLFSTDTRLLLDTITDVRGRFTFNELAFYDNTRFIIQAKTDKGKRNLKIVLDSILLPNIKKSQNLQLRPIENTYSYIHTNKERIETLTRKERQEKSILLQDVLVEGNDRRLKYSRNLNGPGEADQIIYAEDLKGCISLEQCLQGRLVGVRFVDGKAYSTRTPMSINSGVPSMAVIIDGMPVVETDMGALSLINPSEIETIEEVRGAGTVVYGPNGIGGLLIITTKHGNTDKFQSPYKPGIISFVPKGLLSPRPFFSPDYSSGAAGYIGKDLRSTIYWNPNLISDKDGKVSFEFYTADEPGKYRMIIEGIDLEGRLAYSISEFEVR